MSSLRLALKQSLAETGHLAFPDRTVVSHSRKKKSQSNRGKYGRKMKVRDYQKVLFKRKQEMHLSGNVNEPETREEQPTSAWNKHILSTQNTHKIMKDTIQEFSISSMESNDRSETVNYEQNPSDTSTMIVKKKIEEMVKKKKKGIKESCVSLRNPNYSSPEGTPNVGSVKGPTQKVLDWFTNMSVGLQRRKIVSGMRVKVRFQNTQNTTPSKKLSSPLLDHKWYGGVVTHVAKDGSRVQIRYDDGTREVSDFPDKDIVVDAEGNGLHYVQVEEFYPDSVGVERIKQLEKEKKVIRKGVKHESESDSKRWRKQTISSEKKDNSESISSKKCLVKAQNDKYYILKDTLTLEHTTKIEVMSEALTRMNEEWINEAKLSVKESKNSSIVKIPTSTGEKQFKLENQVTPFITSTGKYSLKSKLLKNPSLKRDHRKSPLKEHINLTELPLIQIPLSSMETTHIKSNESNTQDSTIFYSRRKSETETKCTSTNILNTPENESLFVPVRPSELNLLSKEFKRNLRRTKDIDSNNCRKWKSQPHSNIGKEKGLTRNKNMASTLIPSLLFSSSTFGSLSVSTAQEHNSNLSNFSAPKHSLLCYLTVPTKQLTLKFDSLDEKPHLLTTDVTRSSPSGIVPEKSPKSKKSHKEKMGSELQQTYLSSPRPQLTKAKSKQNYSFLISSQTPELKLSNENIKSSSIYSNSSVVVYPTKDNRERTSICKVLKYKPTKKRKCNNIQDSIKYIEESDDHTLSDFDEMTSGASDAENWVKCDRCEKWRLIPSCVNVGDLPDEWYCELNIFDKKRNHCQVPEQTPQQVARERKKKHLKKGISHESTRGITQSIRNLSTSLRFTRKEFRESSMNTLKHETQASFVSLNPTSSINYITNPVHPLMTKNIKNVLYASTLIPSTNFVTKKETISKTITHSLSEQDVNSTSFIAKKDTTTFASTNPDDTSSTTTKLKTNATTTTKRTKRHRDDDREPKKVPHKPHKKQKASNPQEWVQCEKCEKWRRLPRHISAKNLPDVWFCTMNTWDPRSASCAVHEDYKTESYRSTIRGDNSILRDVTNGSSYIVPLSTTGITGKLSYRSLIFGSNGRGSRLNRPISERMSAAESLFSLYRLEDDVITGTTTVPNKVMYANSSVFQSKSNTVSHNTTLKTDNEVSKLDSPLFTFLNQSQFWKDLYQRRSLITTTDNSPISHQNKSNIKERLKNKCMDTSDYIRSMKDIVYSVMKGETLETHELLLRCQCEDFYDTKWSELQASSTFDTIRLALEGLVNDGLVEQLHTKQNDIFCMMTTKYRRKQDRNVHESVVNVNNQNKPQTRCMKIQKPWKQIKLHTEKEWCKIQEYFEC